MKQKILIALLIFLIACQGSEPYKPPQENVNNSTQYYLEGLTFMSQFDPQRARSQFELAVQKNSDSCKAHIGLVLADFQYTLYQINSLLQMVINMAKGSQQSPFVTSADNTSSYRGFDINTILYNFLLSIDDAITEMDHSANKVEELVAKQGWESCVLDMRENPTYSKENEEYGFYPLWIGGNVKKPGDNIYPPLEIRLGPLFDEAEVRFFTTLTTLLQGTLYFIVSHDLTFTFDLTRLARVLSPLSESLSSLSGSITSLLGIDTGACTISFSDGTSVVYSQFYGYINTAPTDSPEIAITGFSNHPPRSDSEYEPGTRVLFQAFSTNHQDLCDDLITLGTEGSISSLYSVLRKLAFFFDENKTFLGKNPDRWNKYFPRVDNVLGESFSQISGLFDALIRRSTAIQKSKKYNEEDLDNFFIYVKESSPNGTLGDNDMIGISLGSSSEEAGKRIDIHFFKDDAKNQHIKALITSTLVPLLKRTTSDKEIQGFQKLFTDLRDNFLAVDNRSLDYKPFKITDLNVVLDATGILKGLLPDAIQFDIPKYFTNPHPLRDYLPYWYKYNDRNFIFQHDLPAEFLIETEWKGDISKEKPALPWYGSLGLLKFDAINALLKKYAQNLYQINSDLQYPTSETEGQRERKFSDLIDSPVALLTFLKNDQKEGWNLKDYDFIGDAPHFSGSYEIAGPVQGNIQPVSNDCLEPNSLPPIDISLGSLKLTLPPRVMPYFAFPDPSFNGMLQVNLDALNQVYGRFIACPNDPSGYAPATNYTLNKTITVMLYLVIDKLGLKGLLGLLGGMGG